MRRLQGKKSFTGRGVEGNDSFKAYSQKDLLSFEQLFLLLCLAFPLGLWKLAELSTEVFLFILR